MIKTRIMSIWWSNDRLGGKHRMCSRICGALLKLSIMILLRFTGTTNTRKNACHEENFNVTKMFDILLYWVHEHFGGRIRKSGVDLHTWWLEHDQKISNHSMHQEVQGIEGVIAVLSFRKVFSMSDSLVKDPHHCIYTSLPKLLNGYLTAPLSFAQLLTLPPFAPASTGTPCLLCTCPYT